MNTGLFLFLLLSGGAGVVAGAGQDAPPNLAGTWRLRESSGQLPEQAQRALDGADGGLTIHIDQSEADVTVRRLGDPSVLLRVMPFAAGGVEHQVPGGGRMRTRAAWRNRALVATGQVAVKQGFLTRRVPVEEVWQVDEGGQALTVTTTLQTPLGVKRRTQVFTRVVEGAAGATEGARPGPHAGKNFWLQSESTFTCVQIAREEVS